MIRHRCEFEPCGREFAARCTTQRFCSVWHRRAAWLASRPANSVLVGSGRFDGCSGSDLAVGLFEASEIAHREWAGV